MYRLLKHKIMTYHDSLSDMKSGTASTSELGQAKILTGVFWLLSTSYSNWAIQVVDGFLSLGLIFQVAAYKLVGLPLEQVCFLIPKSK